MDNDRATSVAYILRTSITTVYRPLWLHSGSLDPSMSCLHTSQCTISHPYPYYYYSPLCWNHYEMFHRWASLPGLKFILVQVEDCYYRVFANLDNIIMVWFSGHMSFTIIINSLWLCHYVIIEYHTDNRSSWFTKCIEVFHYYYQHFQYVISVTWVYYWISYW